MKKSDLKNGHVVIHREYYNGIIHNGGISHFGCPQWGDLEGYDENMKDAMCPELDIMAVYDLTPFQFSQLINAVSSILFLESLDPIWKRKDEVD